MLKKTVVCLAFCIGLCLMITAIGRACEIGWDVYQPTQTQANADGSFSFSLDTTFVADNNTCHTVYFGVAAPGSNNLKNCSITPSVFTGICGNNGVGGTNVHILHTVNAGELKDKTQNGLFKPM